MARNKYPEETIELILDVAYRLFIEQGYEHTSIQSIIDRLGGLSKGAIYHHFKSKEDILTAVVDRITYESNKLLAKFHNNPKLFSSLLNDTIKEVAPNYIQPIIEQGIADGSIQTDYPQQLAEIIILVANVWMNPMTFDDTKEKLYGKIMVFKQMMQGFGLDIIDEELTDRIQELAAIYQKKK